MRQALVIDAVRALADRGVDADFLIAGEGDQGPSLMARACLLLASEPAEKVNGRVCYSQQILQEFGWIESAVGRGVTPTSSGGEGSRYTASTSARGSSQSPGVRHRPG